MDAPGVLHPDGFHDAYDTVGHGPVHLRQVPELQVLFCGRFVVLRCLGSREPSRFRQQVGLVVLEVDDPVQRECFHLPHEACLEIDGIGDENVDEPAAQLGDEIAQQRQGASHLRLTVPLKPDAQEDREGGADHGDGR